MSASLPFSLSLALAVALAAGPASEFVCHLPRPSERTCARMVGALCVAASVFTLLFWLTLRPGFSALGVWAGGLALAFTNNAKLATLREPLLADDRAELFQVVTHPGFYLPFLNRSEALGLISAGLAVPLALVLDAPVDPSPLPNGLFGLLLRLFLGGACGYALWRLAAPALLPRIHAALSHRPEEDMVRLGFLGTFGLRLLASWDEAPRRALRVRPGPWIRTVAPPRDGLPHILAVENESFVNIGRLHPELGQLLPGLTRLRERGATCAPLEVPAFGANTIRTEFSFLCGRAPEELGMERFQPYARLARRPMDSLAWRLAGVGYRTVCLHPNAGAFYARTLVMPALGFQEFHDSAYMGPLKRFGPHAADLALADYALRLLRQADHPLFLFAISMENHSPWTPGRLSNAELSGIPEHAGSAKLDFASRCYLRHLCNADAMLEVLACGLENAGGGVLCFFGDHQPNLPALGLKGPPADTRSDAVLWRCGTGAAAQTSLPPLAAHQLPLALLRAAGLAE